MKKSVKSILNGLVVPVMIADEGMKILYINAAAMGKFPSAKIGLHLKELFDSQKFLTVTKRVLDGDPEFQVKVTLQDVVPTSFRVNVAPMSPDNSDDLRHAILSFEDISHIREAEQMRHDFVANVSHELRSPLTALMGFIETLQGPAKGDEGATERFLDIMSKESERMSSLIEDLLSLSKLQARERFAPDEQVDLEHIINGILSRLGGHVDSVRARVIVDLSSGLHLVKGDVSELTQVFQNLIENAVKYSPEDKPIHVTSVVSKKSKDHVCICVKDQGDGIDPIHIPRLTERFYRIDKGRSRAIGGTGLGLAIVKHILIRHRGWMKIKSELGQGSEFSVFLPRFKN